MADDNESYLPVDSLALSGPFRLRLDMPRFLVLPVGMALLALATSFGITGCGSIHTAPLPSSSVRLTPNPPKIYLAPFNTATGKWLVGRDGVDLVDFKKEFQTNFIHQLETRLMKLAPTEPRWLDDLPDHGWLVAGEFVTVFQGSRFLRGAVGFGAGETTLQTNVYVYDLDVSKTQYVLAFRTGVPNQKRDTGAGSGSAPLRPERAGRADHDRRRRRLRPEARHDPDLPRDRRDPGPVSVGQGRRFPRHRPGQASTQPLFGYNLRPMPVWFHALDLHLLYLINQAWSAPWLDPLMARVSDFNSWRWPLVIGAVLTLLFGGFRGRQLLVLMAACLVIGDGLIDWGFKLAVHRPRPLETEPHLRVVTVGGVAESVPRATSRGRSFTSGHACNNVALAFVGCAIFGRWAWFLWPWAALVSYSRVYGAAHYPSDIAGSWIVAICYSYCIVWAAERLWQRFAPEKWPALYARHPRLFPLCPGRVRP